MNALKWGAIGVGLAAVLTAGVVAYGSWRTEQGIAAFVRKWPGSAPLFLRLPWTPRD